jgi:hypothetical protein
VNQAIATRFNIWLIVAIVAVLLLVVVAALLAPTAMHAVGGTLQGPQPMAPVGCGALPLPC